MVVTNNWFLLLGVVTKEFFSPMFDVLGLCETGTAFVKFKSKDSVEKCLTAAEDEVDISLQAVSLNSEFQYEIISACNLCLMCLMLKLSEVCI
jgi:hypothetical protein